MLVEEMFQFIKSSHRHSKIWCRRNYDIHRPDERHIRYQDAREKAIVYTEYNIEGNPEQTFIDLVLEIKPTQVTLVPDAIDAITSNAGWNTVKHEAFLTEVVQEFQRNGIRTSIFVDPLEMIEGAKKIGTENRIVYRGVCTPIRFRKSKCDFVIYTISNFSQRFRIGNQCRSRFKFDNIQFFKQNIPGLLKFHWSCLNLRSYLFGIR
jgi:pyridoxine 5-phosphate synthase